MKLEKASEEHDLHSGALDKARGLWNKLLVLTTEAFQLTIGFGASG